MKRFLSSLGITLLPAIAVGWWYLVSQVAVWMWFELFTTRSQMGDNEALLTFIALAGLSLTAIPQFYWLPVHLYKLIKFELDREIQREIQVYCEAKRKSRQTALRGEEYCGFASDDRPR